MQGAALTDEQRQFVESIRRIADATKAFRAVQYADATPSSVTSDLQCIDRALTTALQALLSLRLQHREGQDLEREPFNWPVVQALRSRRLTTEVMRLKGSPAKDFMAATYPTGFIDELKALRDAARSEAAHSKPKRGNSEGRSARTAAIGNLGKNFVFQYRSFFGQMPPITKTGWVVDAMSEALSRAGLESADAAEVLRRAIEKDSVGRKLLPSARGTRARGDGSNTSSTAPLKRRRKS